MYFISPFNVSPVVQSSEIDISDTLVVHTTHELITKHVLERVLLITVLS